MTGVRAAGVLVLALVVQSAVVVDLRVLGVHGELLLLVPIAAGLTIGPDRGAVAGFIAGMALDLLVTTPFGLSALTYSLVGYGVGAFQAGVLRTSRWLPIVAALAGTALGVAFFALAATVVGEEGLLRGELGRVALVASVMNGLLVLPAVRIARWVETTSERPILGLR
jgi:rod shape-determining protein MreD